MSTFFRHHLLPVLPTLLLAIVGVAAAIAAFNYDVGSFTSMGPGFVPLALGIILSLLCLFILWREPPVPAAEKPGHIPFAWRPFCAVAAGILAWVVLVETAGFFIATVCQVLFSALALPGIRWRSTLILAVLLAIGGYLLFIVQLGVPLSIIG